MAVTDNPNLWDHQRFALTEIPRRVLTGETKICLVTPTGGGKTDVACGLVEWGLEQNYYVVLYTNRKLLITQLSEVLASRGIRFGVRASGYENDMGSPVQVSSLPTEGSRVLRNGIWNVHGSGSKTLAIVDEAHLNKEAVAEEILDKHSQAGGIIVGLTATPLDLAHIYDSLVIAGTMSELRKCGALVTAYHFGPDEPDMAGFKPNVKTGEYTEGDLRKAIMTKVIFGRVWDNYQKINPDGRPTLLFAPGVQESIWFAEQLQKKGIRSAHIDGEGVWVEGAYQRGLDRQQIIADFKSGRIGILSNRFVLREGINIPEISHIIVATVMGGLQTYLQALGRGMRTCQGKDVLTIQDHGGCYLRHGSVNADRVWNLSSTEASLRAEREQTFRDGKNEEPIRCPKCDMMRTSGPTCPKCGYSSTLRSRMVIQRDGTLREYQGNFYKPRKIFVGESAEEKWRKVYYRARNSKSGMTFRQAETLFASENDWQWPSRDMRLMPKNPKDWFRAVADVEQKDLL